MGQGVTFPQVKDLIFCIALLSLLLVQVPVMDAYGGDGPFALTISEPRGLSVRIGNGNLTLSWAAPEKGAATMTGYNLYRAFGDDAFVLLTALPASDLTYRDKGLENGAVHSYRVTAFNLLEESDPSTTVKAAPDGTAPTLVIDHPGSGTYIPSATVIVRWSSEDSGSGLSRFEVSLDNAPFTDNGQGTSIELNLLENGKHSVRVRAIDGAENEREKTVNFTVDTAPPLLRILSPREGEVVPSPEVTVSWAAEDAHGRIKDLTYRYDSDRSVVLGPAVISKDQVAANGRHTVNLDCSDMAGNTASVAVNFTVDLEDPILIVLHPSDGSYLNTSSVLCTWYTVDSATNVTSRARMDLGPAQTISEGTNITYHDLSDGWHKLDITVEDRAGRTVEAGSRFMVDTVAPVLEITSPDADRPVSNAEPMLSWKAAESGSGVRYCYISVDDGPYKRSDRLDSGKVRLYGDGPHNVSVMAEDRSGNKGAIDFILVLDTEPPQVISLGPKGGGLDSLEDIWVLFDEEIDPLSIVVTVPGISGLSALDGGRNVTFVVLERPLYGSEYHVDIRAADLAGNPSGDVSWSFSLSDEGRVTGKVMDDDGRELGGALIVLDDGSSYVCRDDGSFDIGVRMGERTFYFTAMGHQRYRRTVLIGPASTHEMGNIILERENKEDRQFLDGVLRDPMTIFLAVLFVILLVLAAVNLLGWSKDRGILRRKARDTTPPRYATALSVREDEHRARKGSTFRSGRR